MKCDECGREFAPDDPDEHICPTCQVEQAREDAPELLLPDDEE